ncbi:hypothetical protein BDW74DRAFT_175218 [Aspergillus multicolor]|uniref:uncharacterized protein n=1 Tax=Aspergillus multicolor TaxID=41759 RepID=UPI003CCD3BA7
MLPSYECTVCDTFARAPCFTEHPRLIIPQVPYLHHIGPLAHRATYQEELRRAGDSSYDENFPVNIDEDGLPLLSLPRPPMLRSVRGRAPTPGPLPQTTADAERARPTLSPASGRQNLTPNFHDSADDYNASEDSGYDTETFNASLGRPSATISELIELRDQVISQLSHARVEFDQYTRGSRMAETMLVNLSYEIQAVQTMLDEIRSLVPETTLRGERRIADLTVRFDALLDVYIELLRRVDVLEEEIREKEVCLGHVVARIGGLGV